MQIGILVFPQLNLVREQRGDAEDKNIMDGMFRTAPEIIQILKYNKTINLKTPDK